MDMRTIDDEAGFASISGEWDSLLQRSRQDGPFLRHEWLLAWWRAFHRPEDRLMVLTCRDAGSGDLLGVLPAFETRSGAVSRACVVRLLGDDHVGSMGLGAFMGPEREQEVAQLLANALLATDARRDVIDLRLMDAASPFFARVQALPGKVVRTSADCHASPCIALPAAWGDYLRDRVRKRVRRAAGHGRRQLERLGAEVQTVSDACALPGALDDMLRLWEDRMREVVGPRFCAGPECHAFFAEVLPVLLSQGRLRLRFIVIDGRRIAVDLALRYRDTTHDLLAGFDSEWSRYSVSNVLGSYVVQGAIDEGCVTLDLGLGEQPYKFEWGVTDVARFSDVRLYSRSAAARIRRGADACVEAGTQAIEALPPSFRPPLRRAGKSIRTLARRLRS